MPDITVNGISVVSLSPAVTRVAFPGGTAYVDIPVDKISSQGATSVVADSEARVFAKREEDQTGYVDGTLVKIFWGRLGELYDTSKIPFVPAGNRITIVPNPC